MKVLIAGEATEGKEKTLRVKMDTGFGEPDLCVAKEKAISAEQFYKLGVLLHKLSAFTGPEGNLIGINAGPELNELQEAYNAVVTS